MLVNYIIPICNMGGSDIKERYSNLNFIINNFLEKEECSVNLILVEQVVSGEYLPIGGRLKSRNRKLRNVSIDYVKVHHPVFNKPWLYNIGVRRAVTANIIIAESDMYTDRPLLSKVVKYARANLYPWCFCWSEMRYLSSESKDLLMEGGISIDDLPVYAVRKPSQGWMEGGPLFFDLDFWVNRLFGANEMYQKLGGIDNDLCFRAKKLSNVYPRYERNLYHMWHKDCSMKNDPQRKVNSAYFRYLAKGENYKEVQFLLKVVNLGNLVSPVEFNLKDLERVVA